MSDELVRRRGPLDVLEDGTPVESPQRPVGRGLFAGNLEIEWSRARVLAACVVAEIAALALLQAFGTSTPLDTALRVLLIPTFAWLTAIDLAAGTAIAVFELVIGGASGHWARYGGSITGRHVLDAIVTVAALVELVRTRREGRFGAYLWHALALAVVIPCVWIAIGIAYGNSKHNAVGDGNGIAFLGFTLVVVALMRRGTGEWFRRVFRAACVANAVVLFVLALLAAVDLVSLDRGMNEALLGRLDMGGVVGVMPNGAFRLFVASSLYLVVGLVLVAYELLRNPRSLVWWAAWGVLLTDLLCAYTRGLWLAAFAGVVLVWALAARNVRVPATVAAVTLAGFVVVGAASSAIGRPLTSYILDRGASTLATKVTTPPSHPLRNGSFERPLSGGNWAASDAGRASLAAATTAGVHVDGKRALRLTDTAGNEDDYVGQYVTVKPGTSYVVTAAVTGSAATPVANRGLFLWDPRAGTISSAALPPHRAGAWRRVVAGITTGKGSNVLQLRLYAGLGTLDWDAVRVRIGTVATTTTTTPTTTRPKTPPTTTTQTVPSIPGFNPPTGNSGSDVAGEVSNSLRVEEFHVLVRHIKQRPLLGSGFGAIAPEFPSVSYRYELSYLDVLYKTGIVGLLLFLSFPVRLLIDALRGRAGRIALPAGVEPRATAVVAATLAAVMLASATNPYLLDAFGIAIFVVQVAWLDARTEPRRAASLSGATSGAAPPDAQPDGA